MCSTNWTTLSWQLWCMLVPISPQNHCVTLIFVPRNTRRWLASEEPSCQAARSSVSRSPELSSATRRSCCWTRRRRRWIRRVRASYRRRWRRLINITNKIYSYTVKSFFFFGHLISSFSWLEFNPQINIYRLISVQSHFEGLVLNYCTYLILCNNSFVLSPQNDFEQKLIYKGDKNVTVTFGLTNILNLFAGESWPYDDRDSSPPVHHQDSRRDCRVQGRAHRGAGHAQWTHGQGRNLPVSSQPTGQVLLLCFRTKCFRTPFIRNYGFGHLFTDSMFSDTIFI